MVPLDKQTVTVVRVGVPNVEASGNVWLTKEHDAFVTPRL
jgi:hypothetical protein